MGRADYPQNQHALLLVASIGQKREAQPAPTDMPSGQLGPNRNICNRLNVWITATVSKSVIVEFYANNRHLHPSAPNQSWGMDWEWLFFVLYPKVKTFNNA